jgi:uncharacterized protein
MGNTALKSENLPVAEYLLGEADFETIRSGNNNYLFLADSLRFFRITNRSIEEYLTLCMTPSTNNLSLTGEDIIRIGEYLQQDEKQEPESAPVLDCNFLILNITGGCNLACKYCFAETAENKQSMSLKIAQKAIDNLLSQKNEIGEYSIYYFGGEPLLKKVLLRQITEYAYREIVVKRNKKVNFLINTNATLINEEALELFRQYRFGVTVSIDGPREIHDANRIYHTGKGSYGNVVEKINLLKKYHITTNLRATFSPKIKNLVSVFDFFEKLQLPYAYSFTLTSDYKSNSADTHFDERQLEKIDRELHAVMDYFVAKIINRETIFCSGLYRKIGTIGNKIRRTHSCEAGRRSLTVDENGNYFACQNMIPYKQTGFGNVNTNINDLKRRQFMSKDMARIPQCRHCSIRNLCLGGCEVERINAGNLPDKQMCRFFKMEWRNILYAYSRLMEFQDMQKKIANN